MKSLHELTPKELAQTAVNQSDALEMVDAVLGLIESLTANQRSDETPINTAGLCYLAMLTRQEMKRTLHHP